jgi:phospholipid/cholesterol/gamma-HCH transport system substrate-binding protein
MTHEIKVGLAILIAALLFFIGIRVLQGLPVLRGTYELHSIFDDAGGLVPGNPVLANGVKVGSVKNVALDPPSLKVHVVMRLDRNVAIPEGSMAEISGLAALGGTSLNIHLSDPSRAPLQDGSFVEGRTSGSFADFTGRIPDLVDRVESVLSGLDATLHDVRSLVGHSRGDIDATLTAFRSAADDARAVMQAERVRIASLMQTAERALLGVETVAADAHAFAVGNQDTLRIAIQRAGNLLGRMDRAAGELEEMLSRIDVLATRVERGEGDLGRLLQDEGLYARADSAVSQINRILIDFEREPGRYLRHLRAFSVF